MDPDQSARSLGGGARIHAHDENNLGQRGITCRWQGIHVSGLRRRG